MINKKIIGVLLVLFTTFSAVTCSASAKYEEVSAEINAMSLPSGDMEELITEEIQSDDTYLEAQEENEESRDTELSGFYASGIYSDYAREYFATTENAEEKLALYDAIWEDCCEIANLDEDIPMESFNYSTGTEYHPQYSSIPTSLDSFDIYTVYFMFRNDHPEFYWLSNYGRMKYSWWGSNFLLLCVYDEYGEAEVRKSTDKKLNQNIEKALDEVSGYQTDYDTIKAVHDYLCNTMDYGYIKDEQGNSTGIPLDTPEAHSIVAMFDGDTSTDGVCESYAKAFKLMLDALNIDNIYVTGNAGEPHAWNMAKIDDNYYYFDVTWDDQTKISYNYFAGGTKVFVKRVLNNPNTTVVNNFLYNIPEVGLYRYVKPFDAEYTFKLFDIIGNIETEDYSESLACIKIEVIKDDTEQVYGDGFVLYDSEMNIIDNDTFKECFTTSGMKYNNDLEEIIDAINNYSVGVKDGTRITLTPLYRIDHNYKWGASSEIKVQNGVSVNKPVINHPIIVPGIGFDIDIENNILFIYVDGNTEDLLAAAAVYDSSSVVTDFEVIPLVEGNNECSFDNMPDKIFIWQNMTPVLLFKKENGEVIIFEY